eukprot:5176025-Prymnesium_polylepis.2
MSHASNRPRARERGAGRVVWKGPNLGARTLRRASGLWCLLELDLLDGALRRQLRLGGRRLLGLSRRLALEEGRDHGAQRRLGLGLGLVCRGGRQNLGSGYGYTYLPGTAVRGPFLPKWPMADDVARGGIGGTFRVLPYPTLPRERSERNKKSEFSK